MQVSNDLRALLRLAEVVASQIGEGLERGRRGASPWLPPSAALSEEYWQQEINLNPLPAVCLDPALLPKMLKRKDVSSPM